MKKLIVVLGIIFLLVSCGSGSGTFYYEIDQEASDLVPLNASIIKDHGNGWVEFELDGNRYLYRHIKSGNHGYSAVTQIK